MVTIKLMADFGCWPLWDLDNSRDIDPETLPLSDPLLDDLDRWVELFEEDFEWANSASGEWEPAHLDRFEAEGVQLWRRLRQELRDRYRVVYYSSRWCRVVDDPAELERPLSPN